MKSKKFSMKPFVENYLQTESKARERANKNRAIVNMLMERFPSLTAPMPLTKDYMTDVVREALGMDRCWRKILEENESLRGSDYDEKEVLEDEAQIELEYRPGHDQDVKKLKVISQEEETEVVIHRQD